MWQQYGTMVCDIFAATNRPSDISLSVVSSLQRHCAVLVFDRFHRREQLDLVAYHRYSLGHSKLGPLDLRCDFRAAVEFIQLRMLGAGEASDLDP